MSLEIGALVLLAAAMHAGWNALIKIQGDRLAVMAVVKWVIVIEIWYRRS